jgi:hypothetical protein
MNRTSDDVWDTPNDGVIYCRPELHGGELKAPIGFLHWSWQFKPAPKKAPRKKPAPSKKRARSN